MLLLPPIYIAVGCSYAGHEGTGQFDVKMYVKPIFMPKLNFNLTFCSLIFAWVFAYYKPSKINKNKIEKCNCKKPSFSAVGY